MLYPFAVECVGMTFDFVRRVAFVMHDGHRLLAVEGARPLDSGDLAALEGALKWAHLSRVKILRRITQRPLAEVSAGLSKKTPLGTALGSAALGRLPAALHADAHLSARVESARAIQEATDGLQKVLDLLRGPKGEVAMDRSKFIETLQQTANRLGLRNADPDKRGSLQDFGSERRLAEIYRQQVSGAQNRAYYLSGQDPDILDAWPAQELVRVRASKLPRDWEHRWAAAGGRAFNGRMIALKTDPVWAKISRFGRPWPPFDYNSGMGLEEIDREEAEALGLIKPSETIEPSVEADAAAMRESSLKGVSPEIRALMQREFGDQLEIDGDVARWKGTPDAQKKIDQAKKKTNHEDIDERDSPQPEKPTSGKAESGDPGKDEGVSPGERAARRDPAEFRRVGQAAGEGFRSVFGDLWAGSESGPDDRARNRGIEAQVAAAAAGTKPLFFEPFGPFAEPAAAALQPSMPPGAIVTAADGYLFVYRPEAVRPILDSDPDFYRPTGEDDFAAILRATQEESNGELLGYGARQYSPTGGARVTIADDDGSGAAPR